MNTCIVTIATVSRLHRARALMRSVATHHPEADRFCVLLARDPRQADTLREEFTVIPVPSLGLPDGDDFLFQYGPLELGAAVKPWVFEHLFSRGYDTVVFIDADVRLYRPLVEAYDLLNTSADVVLTPHLTAPISSGRHPDERDVLQTGSYNLGFLAVKRTKNASRFMRWWQGKLRRECELAPDRGLFADQRWCDLLPGMFERVAILRHPGYNVGYWNLEERRVHAGPAGMPMAGDDPLVFFHFSGFDPGHPEVLTYGKAARVVNEAVLQLTREYARGVRDLGAAWYAGQMYDLGVFADGGRIADADRSRFRRDEALRRACAGRPFSHPELLRRERHDGAEEHASASSFSEFVEHGRLQSLSEQLLGRPATPAEIRAWLPRMRGRRGMVRLLLATGLSREARRTPGWLARLLHYIADSPTAAGPVREYAVMPLISVLSLAAGIFPNLAYRRCVRSDDTVVAEPHPKGSSGHADASSRAGELGHAGIGINILGYFSSELGIGEAARSLANSCGEAGIAVSRIDVGKLFNAAAGAVDGAMTWPQEYRPIDILSYNADATPAAARHLRGIGHHSGYRIGFWHWEQPVLPRRFHDAFAEVDEIWVPSTFIQEAVAPVAPVPVVKIPHAVRFTPTPGVRRAESGLPEDKCLVLVMYDFHSVQYRKNPQAAVAAFQQAKLAEPSLGLVIKTINAEHHDREREELQETLRDVPDVTIIDAALTRQQTWDLEMCCDILLSLHRAEGFGLILAEMMYLGKPVVATGWSANMDFMDDSNSLPVPFELRPLPRPMGPYEAGVPWAEPDVDYAAAALRRLVNDRELAARLGHNARLAIQRGLDPQVIGARIRERLEIIQRWFPRAAAMGPG